MKYLFHGTVVGCDADLEGVRVIAVHLTYFWGNEHALKAIERGRK
jgi:hypothetical protein